MTDTLRVQWTLSPAHAPQPVRHCASCGTTKPFHSSGKIRLNANGKRLDAWLIYRCVACDRTWLHTLLERVVVQHVAETELYAMEHSSPAWVRQHEYDIAALKRETDMVLQTDDLILFKPAHRVLENIPDVVELSLVPLEPTGLRLDRFLSRELPISRTRLDSMHAEGKLILEPGNRKALRGKINSCLKIILHADAFNETEIFQFMRAFFENPKTDR